MGSGTQVSWTLSSQLMQNKPKLYKRSKSGLDLAIQKNMDILRINKTFWFLKATFVTLSHIYFSSQGSCTHQKSIRVESNTDLGASIQPSSFYHKLPPTPICTPYVLWTGLQSSNRNPFSKRDLSDQCFPHNRIGKTLCIAMLEIREAINYRWYWAVDFKL